jgi:hypothetical protein
VSYNRKSNNYKYTTIIKSALTSVCFIILILLIYSCTKVNEFTTGTDFIDSQTDLKIIDTFKVDLSTIMLDSLWTSGTKMAFVGSYNDEELGIISSSSFFELGFPTLSKLSDEAIFDSASFVFSYSGDSYGDTTSLMSISIHQITDRLTLYESGYLYNNSVVPYDSKVLGSKTFAPYPTSADTILKIAVNDFGEKIFNLIQENNEIITTSDLFLDYLKGFAIISESGNKAIIGLTADANHISMKLYYHINGIATEKEVITIPYGATDVQFNKVDCDADNPIIKKIRGSSNIVPASDLGNKAYLHGVIGLLPKIQFPTLQNLFLENRWKILKAELICEPVKWSYTSFKLPQTLYLYDTDNKNGINNQLYSSTGYITSRLTLDEYFNEDTRYTFDITSFIKSEISDTFFDYEHGLLIGLNGTDLISTFGRMVIEGKNPTVKLRLYYLTY